jgi:hypothetical protein
MPEGDKSRRVAYNCPERGNTLSREPTAANSYLMRESPTLDGLNERWRCNVSKVHIIPFGEGKLSFGLPDGMTGQ